jgi:iron complex outermembrane receptor protein
MTASPLFKRHPLAAAISLAAMGASAAAPAFGQGAPAPAPAASAAPEDGAAQTVTVTVTAQGRRENILKIPYNISAISGDALDEHQITQETDMLRGVAGASVVDRGARNAGVVSGVTLRGMDVNGSGVGDYQLSTVPTVSTYVNNTPIFANFLIKDVDRVEVLRGPQGTLYGSGSLGGTVRYITRRPELHQFSGQVDTTVGKTTGSGGLNVAGDTILNVPLGSVGALRVVAGKTYNAGVIDYVNVYQLDASGAPVAPNGVTDAAASYRSVKDADSEKVGYARVSYLLKPSADFSGVLTFQSQHDDIGGRRQPTRGTNGLGQAYGKYENGSVQLEPSERNVVLDSLELDWDLGFATLSSGSSHYDQHGSSISENTGFYAQNQWLADYYYNYPRPMAQAVRTYGDKAFVQELKLVSRTGGSIDYVAGLYYQDQDLAATQNSYLRGFKAWADAVAPGSGVTTENDFSFDRKQKFRERALFGELTYHWSPVLRTTVGMRAFRDEFSNASTMSSGVFSPVLGYSSLTQDDAHALYKGNVSYDLSARQMLYATVSQGYRRGGTNVVPLVGTYAESPAFESFKPDTANNFEVGLKGSSADLRYSVSLFDIEWKNIQVDTSTPIWGFFAAQNGGRARSRGLELELSGRFAADYSWNVAYSFLDARLTEDIGRADDRSIIMATAGERLPGSARNTLSAAIERQTMLGELEWINHVGVYYQGSTRNSLSTSPKYSQTWRGFSLWDVSSTLSADAWRVSLFVKNLFNQAGVSGGILEPEMGTDIGQNYLGNGSKVFISQPRTTGLSMTYRF